MLSSYRDPDSVEDGSARAQDLNPCSRYCRDLAGKVPVPDLHGSYLP